MKRSISPEIERVVRQSTLSLNGEDGNVIFVSGESMRLLLGYVPTACYQRIPCEQGRSDNLPEGAG
jgi:hypothetical protein